MADRASTLGLEGMDPLSYFKGSKPRRGSYDFKTQVQGLTYVFASQANLDRFMEKPESFLPQFGGHCAFACGMFGQLKPGSAKDWKIINGKLYLNGGPNTAWLWNKFPALIGRGHDNYRSKVKAAPRDVRHAIR